MGIDFAGSNVSTSPRINCGCNSDFNFGTGDLTFMLIICPHDISTRRQQMFSKDDLAGRAWEMELNPSSVAGRVNTVLFCGGTIWTTYTTNSYLVANTWYVMFFTRTGNQSAIWLNGSKPTIASVNPTTAALNYHSNVNLYMAYRSYTNYWEGYDGLIASAAMWNVKLADDLIISISKSWKRNILNVASGGLIRYWFCDDFGSSGNSSLDYYGPVLDHSYKQQHGWPEGSETLFPTGAPDCLSYVGKIMVV